MKPRLCRDARLLGKRGISRPEGGAFPDGAGLEQEQSGLTLSLIRPNQQRTQHGQDDKAKRGAAQPFAKAPLSSSRTWLTPEWIRPIFRATR